MKQPTCPLFISRYFQPGCHNVDALSLDWASSYHSVYAFPPLSVLERFFEHLHNMSNLECLVITSLNSKRQYMHLLFPDGRHFRPEVVAFQFLLRGRDICRGPVGRPGFLEEPFQGHKFMFVALLWRSRDFVSRVGTPALPPQSQFKHRICLLRHMGGVCDACLS